MLADCLKLYTGGILSIQMIHAQPLRLMDTNRRLLHFYRHMMMVTKSFIFFFISETWWSYEGENWAGGGGTVLSHFTNM